MSLIGPMQLDVAPKHDSNPPPVAKEKPQVIVIYELSIVIYEH